MVLTKAEQFTLDLQLSSAFEQTLTHSNMWENFHSKPYEQTAEDTADFIEYTKHGLTQFALDETHQNEESVIADTKQSAKAKPIVYFENPKIDVELKGFLNARKVAESKGITADTYIRKSSFHKNRHTNILLFVLDRCMPTTWKLIYNAMMNNKTVVVRYEKKNYKNIKPGTDDFEVIADAFKNAKQRYLRLKEIERAEYKQSLYGFYNITLERKMNLEVLKQLYEIDGTDIECIAMINSYLKAGLAPTLNITASNDTDYLWNTNVQDGDSAYVGHSSILDRIALLPMELLEWLVPKLNISYGADYIGNEDLLDATVLGYGNYGDESY